MADFKPGFGVYDGKGLKEPESNTTSDEEMEALRKEYSEDQSYSTPEEEMEALRQEYGLEKDESEKYLKKYKPQVSQLEAGVSGLASGLSAGLSNKVTSYLQSKMEGIPIEEAIKEQKARQSILKAAYPKTFIGTQIGGNIYTGSKFPSAGGQGALGATAYYGESDKANPLDSKGDLLKGFGTGYLAQKGFDNLAKLPFLKDWLRKKSSESAVKAVTGGGQLAAIREASRRPGGIKRTGEHILENDQMMAKGKGGKLLGWATKGDELAEQLADRQKEYGQLIGDIGQVVDTVDSKLIDGAKIADSIEDTVNKYLLDIPLNEAERSTLLENAAAIRSMGKMSFADAQKLKDNVDYKQTGATKTFSDNTANALYKSIMIGMDDAVKLATSKPGLNDDMIAVLNEYSPIKQRYQTYKILNDAAVNFGEKDLARRFISPSDHLGGALGLGLAASQDANLAGMAGLTLAGAVGNKLIRERGRSFSANTLNKLANLMEYNPEFMNKYGTKLVQVVQDKGIPLAIAHEQASRSNPDYAKYFEEENSK